MNLFKSMAIAFAMYSKVPVPIFNWEEKNMRYAICFFPFVGAVIGAVFYFWNVLSGYLGVNTFMYSAVATAIPVFITGGIHADGFCDTTDALASNQPKERKLEILKDSNAGAFAVIYCVIYYILYFGAVTMLYNSNTVVFVAFGFVISRILSALAVQNFKFAKKNSSAAAFKSSKNIINVILIIMLILMYLLALDFGIILGLCCIGASLVSFAYYGYMSYKQFGGITGDLAGYFVMICELSILYFTTAGELVLKL